MNDSYQNQAYGKKQQYEAEYEKSSSSDSDSGEEFNIEEEDDENESKERHSVVSRDSSKMNNQRASFLSQDSSKTKFIQMNSNIQQSTQIILNQMESFKSNNSQRKKSITSSSESQLQLQSTQQTQKMVRKRSSLMQMVGYNGYLNIITKFNKTKLQVPPDPYQALEEIEKSDLSFRESIIVTVLYLQIPKSRKMLSEDLLDQSVTLDIITTERKKFFDWNDSVAVARFFPNDSREKDIFLMEVLTNKLTKNQIKHVIPPLLLLSSKVIIHMQYFQTQLFRDNEDLTQQLSVSLSLLMTIFDKFDFTTFKSYPEEELAVTISNLMPKLIFYSTNEELMETQSFIDILENALAQVPNQQLKDEFLVAFKSRDLLVKDTKYCDLTQKILFESLPKTILSSRKSRVSSDIALRFLQACVTEKGGELLNLKYDEIISTCLLEKQDIILQTAIQEFKKKIESIQGLPRVTEDLVQYLLDIKNECLQQMKIARNFQLNHQNLKEIDDKIKEFEKVLFQSAMRQVMESNQKASNKKCLTLLQNLYKPIEKKLDKGEYSIDRLSAFEQDLQQFLSQYNEQVLGSSQTPTLLDFLDHQMIKVWNAVIQKEMDRLEKEAQAEEEELQQVTSQIGELEKELEIQKTKNQELREKVEELQSVAQRQKKEEDRIEQQYDQYVKEFLEKQQEIREQEESIREMEEEQLRLKEKKRKMEQDQELQRLRTQKDDLQKKMTGIKKGSDGNKNCAACCNVF